MYILLRFSFFTLLNGDLSTVPFPSVISAFVVLCSVLVSHSVSAEPLRVVASFSVLSDWVAQVGGDEVSVVSLVGMDEDVHVYKATPRDMVSLARSDLLVMNGLGLEGWLDRVVKASGFKGQALIASNGISGLAIDPQSHHHHHGQEVHDRADQATEGLDPHAWTSLRQAKVYVQNITQALIAARPSKKSYFEGRAEAYYTQLNTLDQVLVEAFNALPGADKNIVIPHNAFAYLARDYGLKVHSLSGLSTKSETSAQRVADVVRAIQKQNIKAIFAENVMNTRLIEQVQNETQVTIAGTLISGALSEDKAPSYLAMMRYNFDTLVRALGIENAGH